MLNPKDIERFFNKVKISGNCWNWQAAKTKSGYGLFRNNGRLILAHRFSYQLLKEGIPDGLTIDHLCRNRKCVNPEHLEAITLKENLMRGNTIPAKNSKKTHCPKGHEYNEERDSRGFRNCRICHASASKISYNKMKKVKNYSN